jgi:cardiolipin synthase
MAHAAVFLVRGLLLALLLAGAGCGGVAPVNPSDHAPHGDGDGDGHGDGDGDDDGAGDGDGDGDSDMEDADAATPEDDGSDADGGTPASGVVGFHINDEYMPLVDMIDAAASSVDIEIYEMFDGGVIGALYRALSRGVTVRVVSEPQPVGEACQVFEPESQGDASKCVNAKQLLAAIREQGGSYVPFAKDQFCADADYCVQHGKIALVDAKLALVSSGNFNASNLCSGTFLDSCDRDYTVVTDEAAVVARLVSIFEHDLASEAYDLGALLGTDLADKLTVSPLSRAPLVDFIDSAQHTLRIANQYLHEPELNDAIVAAAQRGVDVQVMVASFCAFGSPSSSDRNQETGVFSDFDAAGVKSRAFTHLQTVGDKPGYLHAKAMVADDRAWVGSVNGSTAATSANREFGLFFDEPAAVAALRASLESDFADAGSESWRDSLACQNDF